MLICTTSGCPWEGTPDDLVAAVDGGPQDYCPLCGGTDFDEEEEIPF